MDEKAARIAAIQARHEIQQDLARRNLPFDELKTLAGVAYLLEVVAAQDLFG